MFVINYIDDTITADTYEDVIKKINEDAEKKIINISADNDIIYPPSDFMDVVKEGIQYFVLIGKFDKDGHYNKGNDTCTGRFKHLSEAKMMARGFVKDETMTIIENSFGERWYGSIKDGEVIWTK